MKVGERKSSPPKMETKYTWTGFPTSPETRVWPYDQFSVSRYTHEDFETDIVTHRNKNDGKLFWS